MLDKLCNRNIYYRTVARLWQDCGNTDLVFAESSTGGVGGVDDWPTGETGETLIHFHIWTCGWAHGGHTSTTSTSTADTHFWFSESRECQKHPAKQCHLTMTLSHQLIMSNNELQCSYLTVVGRQVVIRGAGQRAGLSATINWLCWWHTSSSLTLISPIYNPPSLTHCIGSSHLNTSYPVSVKLIQWVRDMLCHHNKAGAKLWINQT